MSSSADGGKMTDTPDAKVQGTTQENPHNQHMHMNVRVCMRVCVCVRSCMNHANTHASSATVLCSPTRSSSFFSACDLFCQGMLNVHPSLIPKYRGPAPLHHTILNGDEVSGVSIIEVSKQKVDLGRVYDQREFSVPSMWALEDLRQHAAQLGAQV